MKRLLILSFFILGVLAPLHSATATVGLKIKTDDILSFEVNRLNGESRSFSERNGYDYFIIDKVVNWINKSSAMKETEDINVSTPPISKMKIVMKNGNTAVVEPAYNCTSKNTTKTCTIADSEVIFTQNDKRVRLKSKELFDWLLVGWKIESVGAPKEELLEETFYFRYFSYLPDKYTDFILCPRVDKIERIEGDTRRHIIHASALNYSSHHGDKPYDRIHITFSDTPERGVEITNVQIERGISGKEARVQCGRDE
ncbi:hypothetical protein [Bacillus sp. EB01]|uniref:hypothetical protein n=1 Tax=Bacillus sp. EB01 TaxID=1347086 RepID=UPI0005C577B5|nr:hypothetical protein [Bacillus sp. EB01]